MPSTDPRFEDLQEAERLADELEGAPEGPDGPGETPSEATGPGAEAPHAETTRAEVAELKDKYLRLMAEFDNFRKRTARERIQERATAAESTVRTLLPVVDDFDRAKATADKPDTEEQFSAGVELVYGKLKRTLEQLGLRAMESTGQAFDPELHEAFTEIPAPSPELVGKVVDTIEPGYFLHDKLIRHAKVVIGK